jgi:hypothetical protein
LSDAWARARTEEGRVGTVLVGCHRSKILTQVDGRSQNRRSGMPSLAIRHEMCGCRHRPQHQDEHCRRFITRIANVDEGARME